jgi:hypothetical protein
MRHPHPPSGDIWAHVDLRGFVFTPRIAGFDWKLVHSVDVDDVVGQLARPRSTRTPAFNVSAAPCRLPCSSSAQQAPL